MLKKRSQAMSIVITIIFCLSFVVPAFVTPDIAQASSTYEVLMAPAVKASDIPQNLGVVKVTLSDTNLAGGDRLTVSLPTDVKAQISSDEGKTWVDQPSVVNAVYKASDYAGIQIVANNSTTNGDLLPAGAFKSITLNSNNNIDIAMADPVPAIGDTADQFFYIYFNGINLQNTIGDIEVDFDAPSNSSFTSAKGLVIAKSSSSGATTTTIKKARDITNPIGKLDSITVSEDYCGTLNFSKIITLEILTPGFTWKNAGTAEFGWSLSGNKALTIDINRRKANLNLNGVTGPINNRTTSEAKITISGLEIEVDSDQANPGDIVEVKLSGADMTPATLVVAQYSADKNLQGTVRLQNSSDNSGVRLSLYQGSSLIAQTTSCADGSYSFSNITPGTYSIRAEKSNWLSAKTEGINVNPGTTTIAEPLSLFFGDLNNDGIVDLFDLVILSQNYGKSAL